MSSLLSPDKEPRNWGDYSRLAKNVFAVGLSLLILVGGGLYAYNKASAAISGIFVAEDYPGPGEADVTVEVPDGSTVDEIGGILHDADVIASTDAFDQAKEEFTNINDLQAGTYSLKTKMKARDAIDQMLKAGLKGGKTFTVIEGLRIAEQYKAISDKTGIPQDKLAEAGGKGAEYGLSPWANGNPEGFLFPDTYQVAGEDPKAPLKIMASTFQRRANEINLEERAKALGKSPRDVVIVASIIEAEVRRPEDRPKVARVLYNRLAKDMPLQLDTTVDYANNRQRGTGATTTDEQRRNPSPYNTYVHKGLPPGPINAPGRQALEAAANPVEGNWLYFVAINLDTGETAFADDFNGHQANVQRWQQWCSANPGKC
ncbi:endolytic transglycosylase MltG [Mariniluteicoccus endophyticus]